MTVLEICVDSVESAIAAEEGGAQQVELCSALLEGGLTPSLGLIRAVRARIGIGVHVMIRPRSGDFAYSEEELAIMREDIKVAAQAGANGVVLGVLTAEGDVDVAHTRELVESARPMEVTFHRAIDVTKSIHEALEAVIQTGADRVLTSGAEPTAVEGSPTLETLIRSAGGRVRIMVGGSVRPKNVLKLAEATGAVEFHSALRHPLPDARDAEMKRIHLGDPGVSGGRSIVRVDDVRELRRAMDLIVSTPAVQSLTVDTVQ